LTSYLKERLPLQRSGLPEDIAYGALYLASEEGSFVTGHDLVIDTGITAGRVPQVDRGIDTFTFSLESETKRAVFPEAQQAIDRIGEYIRAF
jgi:NAD(P)-dependent dehydrogenase (short-subunit alcohol dehydrogenase family)